MADIIRTIGATGADFTTITAWWAARTGGAGDVYRGVLIDAAVYTIPSAISGAYSGAVEIIAAPAVYFDKTDPAKPYASIQSATGMAFNWQATQASLRLQGIDFYSGATTGVTTLSIGQFADVIATIKDCRIRGGFRGYQHYRSTSTVLIEDAVVTDCYALGIDHNIKDGLTVRTCFVARCNISAVVGGCGLRKDRAGSPVINTVAVNNTTVDFFGSSVGAGSSFLSSSDASATGANALTGVTNAAFTNYAAGIFTAASGGVLFGTGPSGANRGLQVTSSAPSITILAPSEWKIFPRNPATNSGSISVSGTYANATPSAIKARYNGGAWVVLDAAPAGGTFSGVLNGIAATNGTLEVRIDDTAVTTFVNNIAIGAIFNFWGQSNFSGVANNNQVFTGNAGWYHKYTIENNAWQLGQDRFNSTSLGGSIFPLLANYLTNLLGCPVGFIGTAVGSTSLAQWQPAQSLNNKMLAYLSAATNNVVEANLSWIGEQDALSGTAEADFKSRYSTIIDQLFALTGKRSMLVAISGLDNANHTNVRQWIVDVAASNPNAVDGVPLMWPLYQKVHYETDVETALAAGAIFDKMADEFYTSTYDAGGAGSFVLSGSGGALAIRECGGLSSIVMSGLGSSLSVRLAGASSSIALSGAGEAVIVGGNVTYEAGGSSLVVMGGEGSLVSIRLAGGVSSIALSGEGGASIPSGAIIGTIILLTTDIAVGEIRVVE